MPSSHNDCDLGNFLSLGGICLGADKQVVGASQDAHTRVSSSVIYVSNNITIISG